MKHLAVLFFVLPFFSQSQSIDVFIDATTTEISGNVYDVVTSDAQEDLYIRIENHTGTNQVWKIERILPSTNNWNDPSLSWDDLSTPFSGDDFIVSAVQSWITPTALSIADNGAILVILRWEAIDVGCDLYQYYILDNDVRVDSFQINICKTVGLHEISPVNVSIYPNPASSILNLDFQVQAPKEVIAFDLLGNKIATFEASESMTISMEGFLNGSYFLSWEIEGMKYNQKFQVQH